MHVSNQTPKTQILVVALKHYLKSVSTDIGSFLLIFFFSTFFTYCNILYEILSRAFPNIKKKKKKISEILQNTI